MTLPESNPRVLLVTRTGALATGGGHGHSVSMQYHAQAFTNVRCQYYFIPLPSGAGFVRKVQTFSHLKNGHIAGVQSKVISDFERTLEVVNPVAVFFDSTLFGPLAVVAKRRGCLVFTQSHNCEYDYYAGESALRGGLAGELLRASYRAESQAIASSDVVFTLSDYDRERLHQIYGGPAKCYVVNPHIKALSVRLQTFVPRPTTVDNPSAVFLGSSGQQNRLACSLLVEKWTGASARLTVIGGVSDWFKQKYDQDMLAKRGINVAGFVASLDDVLCTADAMVCPMHLGSGIKVKMIDALANGCPVIASPEALHGFEFAHASGWVHCCKLDEMEEAVLQLKSADLSLQQLRDDTVHEAEKQARALRSVYASFGLAKQETCS